MLRNSPKIIDFPGYESKADLPPIVTYPSSRELGLSTNH